MLLNKSEYVVFAFLEGVRERFPEYVVEQAGMSFVVLRMIRGIHPANRELLVSSGWVRGGFELNLWSRRGEVLSSHRSLLNLYDMDAKVVGRCWVSLGDPDCLGVVCNAINREGL